MERDAGFVGIGAGFGKRVVKNGPQDLGGGGVGVEGNFLRSREAERSQIVEAKNMVGVGVGVEDGVDAGDVFAQRLLAEVWPRVDKYAAFIFVAVAILYDDGRPGAPVAWVG